MRKAEFDQQQVLRAAMEVFIAKGYSKTSMQDLKQATGLHPGSIYCAFTNKKGLLLAALEHYRNDRLLEFEALFANTDSTLAGIKCYLQQVVDECEREQVKDCLLQKALSELVQQDSEVEQVICAMLKQYEVTLANKFALAQQAGELKNSADSTELAQFFMMGIYGIRTLSHTHPAKGTLAQLANKLFDYLTMPSQ